MPKKKQFRKVGAGQVDYFTGEALTEQDAAAWHKQETPNAEPDETKRRYSYDEMLAAFNAGVENNVAFPDVLEDLLKRRKS